MHVCRRRLPQRHVRDGTATLTIRSRLAGQFPTSVTMAGVDGTDENEDPGAPIDLGAAVSTLAQFL